MYKIWTLQDMHYTVEGVDKAAGIREKAKQIVQLVSEPTWLEEEWEFARKNWDKFKGFSNTDSVPYNTGTYSGFGSKDLEKMGGADAYWPGGNYDPYKKESIFADKKAESKSGKGEKKKKKKKKKTSSSSSSESSEEDSNEEEEKPKKFKKSKAQGLQKPPKKADWKDSGASAPI